MAYTTKYGNTVQSVWRAYAKYQVTNSSNTQTKVDLITGMQSIAWGIDVNYLTGSANINGNVKNGSNLSFHSANGATVSKDLITHSVTYTRTKSKQTKTLTAKIVNQTGYKNGTSTASVSVTVPALPSYKVTFNANGGSGAPATQTKWYGETLKLSSTKPTRTGYTFKGWGTSATTTTVSYAAGANYTSNAADTLYAIWTENTYTVTFNANGGSGGPTSQTKYHTKNLTLSTSKPTRTNYNFLGWATSSTATSAEYTSGGTFTTNANTTLYAVWELAYIAPTITNVSVDRSNSSGTLSDEGRYAKVTFHWQLDTANSGGLKSITIGYKRTTATSYTNTTVTASGTSGTVSKVIGGNALSTEYEYDILITVTDQKGSSTWATSLPAMAYIIDFSPQGGVGIGQPAPDEERFEIGIPTKFNEYKYFNYSTGTSGSSGYVKICSISAAGLIYANGGIRLVISQRGRGVSTIDIALANSGTAGEATVNNAYAHGYITAYYVDAGSQIDIWVMKSESYDSITLSDVIMHTTARPNILMTNEQSSSVPSGAVAIPVWFQPQATNSNRPMIAQHIALKNGIYLQGQVSGGSFSNILGMNTSNQVELTWTTGGLKGRVFKQIWTGTWSSGSITVSEAPYYNFFVFMSSESTTPIPVYRYINDNATLRGAGLQTYVSGSNNAFLIYGFDGDANGTTLTMGRAHQMAIYSNSSTGNTQAITISRIYGVL